MNPADGADWLPDCAATPPGIASTFAEPSAFGAAAFAAIGTEAFLRMGAFDLDDGFRSLTWLVRRPNGSLLRMAIMAEDYRDDVVTVAVWWKEDRRWRHAVERRRIAWDQVRPAVARLIAAFPDRQ